MLMQFLSSAGIAFRELDPPYPSRYFLPCMADAAVDLASMTSALPPRAGRMSREYLWDRSVTYIEIEKVT